MTARRPRRSWYARKRVILPALALIGLLGFGALQNSSNGSQKPGGEVTVADAPSPTPTVSHSPKKHKKPKKKTTEPVVAPPSTTSSATKKAKPHRTTQAPAPDPKPKKTKKPTTTTKSNCNENYAQACVPIAYDVDCAGGGGDGPKYLSGVAKVVGDDVYDLDRDHDGWACDT